MRSEAGIASGIRVVEIGSSAAVSAAGMVLADAGAEVLLLEPPGGSVLREEPAFAMWSRGKQSVVADLGDAQGRERARALVRAADVLLLGLKPASVERFGLREEDLMSDAPGLIVGALSGFGARGPYRNIPVYDAVMQARGGRMYEFGKLFDGKRPAFAAAPVVSHGAAMALLQGVFGALRERERNGGHGQYFETSLAHALGFYDLIHWAPGVPPMSRFEDSPFLSYSVARTSDGVWLQFAQNGPLLFSDFLRVIGLEGEVDYASTMSMQDAAEKRAIREKIQARISQASWPEWKRRFAEEHNISAEPFLAPGEALEHEQFEAIGDVIDVHDDALGATRQLAPLFDVPAQPLRPHGSAPVLDSGGEEPFAPRPARSRPGKIQEASGPGLLAGVTVLEFGMWIALPFAATQLAELGARVIKLEPLAGDPMRSTGPIGFKLVQGKESLAIDLKEPSAREIVHRLVERADVLVHSYRPGVPERLGIDFATLRKLNPRLVYLYNGSYGSRGPKSYAPAFHVTGGAVCGGAFAQAGSGCPPPPDSKLSPEEMARVSRRLELANEANPDFNSAVSATAAVMMGLYAREKSGKAIEIETRMMLSNAMMMSEHFIDYEGRPEQRELDEDLIGFGPLYRLYPAAEGWVFLAAPRQRDFGRLCEALELRDVSQDPRFATAEVRGRNPEALAALLGEAIARHGADALEARLGTRGVACVRADQGPYPKWLFEKEWAREQGLVADVPDSLVGPYTRYGPPLQSSRPAPLGGAFAAGANTRAILDEMGFTSAEIVALIAKRVVSEAAADATG